MTSRQTSEPRVAVIDDEPEIGDIIRRTLRRHYEVDVHLSAQEFFEALEDKQHYDVILCDLFMPQVSGRDVYDELVDNWPEQADRIVFMSGVSAGDAREQALQGLDVSMIEKPFQLDTLRNVVGDIAAQD